MPVQTQFQAQKLAESAGKAFVDYTTRHTFAYTDLNALLQTFIPIEAGKTILEVRVHIAAAFTGATELFVGDGDTANGYFKIGDINPTSLNAYSISRAIAANDYYKGKYYATKGQLILDFTTGTAISAGSVVVEILWAGWSGGFERGVMNNSGQ